MDLSNKAILKDETRDFVPKFVAAALIATDPQKYGFEFIGYDSPLDYEEVQVRGGRQLASLAEIAGVEAQTIEELNPELLQHHSSGENRFRVKLPMGMVRLRNCCERRRSNRNDRAESNSRSSRGLTRRNSPLDCAPLRPRDRTLMELNGLQNSTLRVGQLKVLLQSLRGTLG